VAGIGPPPKPPELRRRRNKVAGTTTLADEGPKGPPPELPKRGCAPCETTGEINGKACRACGGEGVMPWHPFVLEWWADVWASPMANEYMTADKHGLFLLAELHDQFWKTGERELAGEIRLQEQRFGLSPMDRRRLQWQVATTEERLRRGAKPAPRAAAQPARATDPRKVLSMVAGGKKRA
jgi:hypothetical protein